MKIGDAIKVKLLRTIRNKGGDTFRKNSILIAEKRYGGYELTKRKKRKGGTIVSVNRVQKEYFQFIGA